MLKLDAYDKKILEVLLHNSRERITSISKKVHLKRENVTYKLNRLIKEGLIKEFNVILNEKKLNLEHYTVFLELTNLGENTEKTILDYLKKNKYMSWIGTFAGKWSLTFDIILPEKIELDKIMKELLNKFGKYIDNYTILKLQDSDYFPHKFLNLTLQKNTSKKEIEKIKLDSIDLKILSLLNTNGKINYVSIAEKIKLTPNGIVKRIKRLEKSGIINSYTISIDWKKLGYEWHGIQIRQTSFTKETDQKLRTFFKDNEKIIFYYKYIGGQWDYDIGILVKNSNELRDFIHKFRKEFSTEAKISDAFIVLEETSSYKLPEGTFQNAETL
jgi:Lrp/AsnC family leucine-responsive transcriptional regulator